MAKEKLYKKICFPYTAVVKVPSLVKHAIRNNVIIKSQKSLKMPLVSTKNGTFSIFIPIFFVCTVPNIFLTIPTLICLAPALKQTI